MTRQQTTTHAEKGSLAADTIKDSTVQITNIINQSGNNLTPEQVEQTEQQYLKRVMADSKGLEWLRLVSKENSDTPTLGLDSIYTALLTTTSKAADEIEKNQTDRGDLYSRLSALDMLNQHPRLVLIGDPGSGKSAFVNYLCLCMAGELTGHPLVNLKALTAPLPDKDGEPQSREVEQAGKDKEKIPVRQDWQHNALIPIRIILRDFAASKHFPDDCQTADAQLMMAFIQSDLASKDCGDYFDILKARLRTGDALVMFDGLDEVPQAGERRKRLLKCIEGFTRSYADARILVTCRPYAYQDRHWRLADFVESELSVFHRGQIIRFVKQWYDKSPEFEEEVAKKRVHKLLTAIFNSDSLLELAERPLLLSLIAYLHANRHELPERKADLYERLLELLVNEWEKARFKTEDADTARELMQHSLAEFLEIGQDAIRLVLERLAFEAHAQQDAQQKETADISAKDLTHQLFCASQRNAQRENGKESELGQLYEYLRDRVGILYQRGGSDADAIYTFPHRSFQEYLAAAYFRREEDNLFTFFERRTPASQDKLQEYDTWQELAAHLGSTDPDRWREVLILLGGIKSIKEPGPVWDLLEALNDLPDATQQLQAWGLRFAAEILADSLHIENLNRKQKKIFKPIQQVLPDMLATAQLPLVERAAIGRYLGKIGDPRNEVQHVDHMRFSYVPAGHFYMGRGEYDKKEEEWSLSETPAGEYNLNYAYWIAQHPVSQMQFAEFLADTSEQPKDKRVLEGIRNHPVVFVSWDEAIRFCQWLTRRWHQAKCLPENWIVTLPDEAEWEKAARGGIEIPTTANDTPQWKSVECQLPTHPQVRLTKNIEPQRRYPWGNHITADLGNYRNYIGKTSTQGLFSSGVSPYGCHDMAGNVWEWTRSKKGGYPYPETRTKEWEQRTTVEKSGNVVCVLRGGAFFNYPVNVRCAVRYYYGRGDRSLFIGFRVVLSPLL